MRGMETLHFIHGRSSKEVRVPLLCSRIGLSHPSGVVERL